MKKVLILVGLLVIVIAVVVVSVKQANKRGVKVYEDEARKVELLNATVKASGEIQPKVYVNISSQVMGQIVELRVKEGDRVHTGDILLQLDPEQYHAQVERLEASLRLARVNLSREKVALAQYRTTLERREQLMKEKFVSSEDLDQARLAADSSAIQVQAYDEQIRGAEAELRNAADNLSKTTIRAPMSALVTQVNAKLGEQVIVGTMNNPGTVILVLSDMSELLAEVRVDETAVAALKAGQKAVVTVDALEHKKFDGVVTEIAHTAIKEKEVSRFTVKVSLSGETADSGGPVAREVNLPENVKSGGAAIASLRPGMSSHASIRVAETRDALVVPIQAVQVRTRKELEELRRKAAGGSDKPAPAGSGDAQAADGGKPAAKPTVPDSERESQELDVIFVDRGGKVEIVEVRTGLSDEFNVEVLDPSIKPGDKVIIGPYRTLKKLKPGDAVQKVSKDEELTEEK